MQFNLACLEPLQSQSIKTIYFVLQSSTTTFHPYSESKKITSCVNRELCVFVGSFIINLVVSPEKQHNIRNIPNLILEIIILTFIIIIYM